MRRAQLADISLPDFGQNGPEPILGSEIYAKRHQALLARMAKHKFDALVIYGDREHVANISWATGYDPRFEEALYVVVPGRRPVLLAANSEYG